MAFQNIPLRSILASITSVTGVDSMPWKNPLLYPVVPPNPEPPPVPRDYRWKIVMDITTQEHSASVTRDPGYYNGQDVSVGQWIANLTTGQAWQIITIESKDTLAVTAVVQDVYRYNTFRDSAQVGNGAPPPGMYVIFDTGPGGVPLIDPVPPAGTSSTFDTNIQSRFEYINLQYDYPLYQENNSFSIGDVVAGSDALNGFVLADAGNRIVVGRVTSISDTKPGWFTVNPVQKIVDNLDYLPGNIGSIIYTDLNNPGSITTTPGGTELYVKIRNNTRSVTYSSGLGPVTPGSIFQLNGVDVEINGTGSASDVISATNLVYPQTGVSASLEPVASVSATVTSNIASTYGEPALYATSSPATATINGVLVVFDITSTEPGYTDYSRAEQMAQAINNAAITDIIASAPTPLSLQIKNISGSAITIVNLTPDINGVPFAGPNSGSGLALYTPPTSEYKIRFIADDARAINFMNVVGDTVGDLGLVSVENGVKACGLYIEQGLRTATSTVVTTMTQLNSLSPMIGDQAYVINSDDGAGNNVNKWSMWLFDGSSWVVVSTQDSASTDARSLEYSVSNSTPLSVTVGKISTSRRITLITVEVTEAFNNSASLSIGYAISNPSPPPPEPSGLMVHDLIDLGVVGTYTTTTDIIFGIDTPSGDAIVTASFDNNGSTTGHAQIVVSYV